MRDLRLIPALGALAFVGVGAGFVLAAWTGLDLGSWRRLGPGAFPLGLGVILVALGVIVAAGDLRRPFDVLPPDQRAIGAVAAAVAVFALLAERAGVLPAVAASVLVMSSLVGALRWPGRLMLAVGVTAGVWAVFLWALGLPMQAVVWR
jgi:hypothetical protein